MTPVIIIGLLSVMTVTLRVLTAAGKSSASGGFAAKAIASVLFCMAGIAAVSGHEITLPRAGMLAAFIFAFMGDVFLGLGPFTHEKHKSFFFTLGSVPFLLAQLLYIAVLISLAPLKAALLPIAFALPVLYLLLIGRRTLAYLCENTVPILCYGAVVSVMVMAAANAFAAGHAAGAFALPAGVLFAISDTALFLHNFGNDRVRAQGKTLTALVMLPYYAAQALFAMALVNI
ncbi:MAG: lysoplasmalogenase [Oscillospiraceae bacterium]|jgi:uncharacterized membrane protein YhhN|nr:lysoplasmalogenase [Oscillospiraceae bacterium]